MENCQTRPADSSIQEVQVIVVGTSYFRHLTDGALSNGPLDLSIETIKELLDANEHVWLVKGNT